MTKKSRQLDFLADQYERNLEMLIERINKLELQMTLLWPAKIYDLEKSYAKDEEKQRQGQFAI